jgi:predicted transcriptional regulator
MDSQMAIGIVSDDDLQSELDRLNGVKPSPQVEIAEIEKPGRNEGDVNVPDSLRQIIGETSVLEGRQSALALAEMFNISPASVSAYAKGATSTASYDTPSKSIISHIKKSRQRAIKKAQSKLTTALDGITPEKLENVSAKDLSAIAKDMSVVIRNLEPQQTGEGDEGKNTPQFVIFAPQFRDERSFPTMVVQE